MNLNKAQVWMLLKLLQKSLYRQSEDPDAIHAEKELIAEYTKLEGLEP